jgi:hypothetical protein
MELFCRRLVDDRPCRCRAWSRQSEFCVIRPYDRAAEPRAAVMRPLSAVDSLMLAAAAIVPLAAILWALGMAGFWLTRGI